MTPQQERAALDLIAAVGMAVRDLCEASPMKGVPSGELYAQLMASGVTLAQYDMILGTLKHAKLVEEKGHLLTWTGPKKEQKS